MRSRISTGRPVPLPSEPVNTLIRRTPEADQPLPAQDRIPALVAQKAGYTLRFARTLADLEAVHRLRFRVFNLELGEGLASAFETDSGLLLIDVVKGGPADRAGLRGFEVVTQRERRGGFVYERTFVDRENADLVTAIDGHAVITRDEFRDRIEQKKPGDRVVLRVLRGNRQLDVPVTLGASD